MEISLRTITVPVLAEISQKKLFQIVIKKTDELDMVDGILSCENK